MFLKFSLPLHAICGANSLVRPRVRAQLAPNNVKTLTGVNNSDEVKVRLSRSYVLTNQEVAEMRLKILTTSSESTENEPVSPKFTKSHYNPTAFTEK